MCVWVTSWWCEVPLMGDLGWIENEEIDEDVVLWWEI